MANWQTGLMQHVAEQGSSELADLSAVSRRSVRHHHAVRDLATLFGQVPPRSQTAIGHPGHHTKDESEQPRVDELVAILLRQRSQALAEVFVDKLLTQGLAAEYIFLRVFQPAARYLGEMWVEDTCTFVDVTLAMSTLHRCLRALAPHFHRHARPAAATRSVFLTTLDGDQHTFGLAVTAEFFRRSGWAVCSVASHGGGELAGRLRGERNAVVGFSVSRLDQLTELTAAIRQLRRLGRQRIAGIVVGGPLFVTHPEHGRETGADAVGFDARQAVSEAEILTSAAMDGG